MPYVSPNPNPVRGLFVTHSGERCGVWQFGCRLHQALALDPRISWTYVECASRADFEAAADSAKPDVILANLHPFTLPFAVDGLNWGNAVSFAVFHEASRVSVAALTYRPFDVLLCPDPTLLPNDPGAIPVPRFMAPIQPDPGPPPALFTVGSFGFGTPGKGFERLCALVNAQFDEARIRINIPPHNDPVMVPQTQVEAIIADCRAAVTKPGVLLDITQDFLNEAELLRFLAENTLNAFLYDDAPGRGISSCVDYALAVGRPIAVSRTAMFRHVAGTNPSICVEERSLAAIVASGIAGMDGYREAFSQQAAGRGWTDAILRALDTQHLSSATPDGKGYNKLLDDGARAAYTDALADLARLAPAMLERKIERANIQQGFGLDATRRLASLFIAPRILALGSYEDTTVACLLALGYRVEQVDPQVNGMDCETFFRSQGAGSQYDIIVCVSVLEHVPDDETFVRQAAHMLAPGGMCIFTVDYCETYPTHGRKPQADQRLYTKHDLQVRLMDIIPDCALLDTPRWHEGSEDFDYEGCRYAFATWVFRKLPPGEAQHARVVVDELGGPPWKALLRREADAADILRAELSDALLRVEELEVAIAESRAAATEAALHAAPLPSKPTPVVNLVTFVAPSPSLRQRAKWLAFSVYRVTLRPIARPLAWRLRGFMTGQLHERIQAMQQELAAVKVQAANHTTINNTTSAPIATSPTNSRPLEDALLTIALLNGTNAYKNEVGRDIGRVLGS